MTISPDSTERKAAILSIIYHVLDKVSTFNFLKKSFQIREVKNAQRIVIIGIGKAGQPMIKAIMPLLKRKPSRVLFANEGHPLPTLRGVQNTKKILALTGTLTKDDLVIVMISGGGSAMLTSPPSGVSLRDKVQLTKQLLKCGATIQELNVVRKHLSQIKGGRLARVLFPAKVRAYVISDVIGNDLSTISSGPLSADPSTFKDAIAIIKKYKISAPKKITEYFKKGLDDPEIESVKSKDPVLKNVKIKILADHFTVMDQAANFAKKAGFRVIKVPKLIKGEARDAAKKFVKMGKKSSLLIGCGETTVTCKGNGFGGRNQEFVLAGLKYLRKGQTLTSIGTDGVDGMCPEKIAGVIADSETLAVSHGKKLKIDDYLRRNDSYTFFKKTGGHIKTGPTGTNLGDLMMLFTE